MHTRHSCEPITEWSHLPAGPEQLSFTQSHCHQCVPHLNRMKWVCLLLQVAFSLPASWLFQQRFFWVSCQLEKSLKGKVRLTS